MSELRIGAQIQPQHATFDAMRRAWVEAEEIGADQIYTWDHFFPLNGDPDGPHFESLVCQTMLAEVTQRAQVGALVMCDSYRNAQYLAAAMRTIDHVAGGRLIVGIGAGWFQRDYDEYGYEFGTAGSRLRGLARDLPLFKARLAELNPPPVGPMPILIGGAGEKVTLRLVAEHADMWHAFGDLERYKAKAAVLERHCADVGRDPADITHVWAAPGGIAELDAFRDAGVTHFTVGLSGRGDHYDLEPLRALVKWRDAQ